MNNITFEINKFDKYLIGFIIGMCFEYLLRVQWSIYPLIIIVSMIFMIGVEYVVEEEEQENNEADVT